jgi:hypothetical protein
MTEGIIDLLYVESEERTYVILSFPTLNAINYFIEKYNLSPREVKPLHKLEKIEYYITLDDILPSEGKVYFNGKLKERTD